jgi:hypothetical protein
MARSNVDLPQPLGPSTPVTEPRSSAHALEHFSSTTSHVEVVHRDG